MNCDKEAVRRLRSGQLGEQQLPARAARRVSLWSSLAMRGLGATGAGVCIDFCAVALCCGLVSVEGLEIKSGNFPSHNASVDPRRIWPVS